MLIGYKEIIDIAEKKEFAIPAFNVYNMETVMGVINAAKESHAPVILQIYSRLFNEGGAFYIAPMILKAAQEVNVPVCFHIDHGAGELEITRAIRYGCSGIMIDASACPYEENAAITKRIVTQASYVGIAVEGELGHVGTVNDSSMDEFTVPEDAKDFVEKTGVTSLAVLVGNAHGRYKKPPKLDIQRIADIRKATGIPLVLHGGSGIPDLQVQEAIKAGIRKVNYGTDVCYAFLDEVFKTSRDIYAIDLFMKNAIHSVEEFAKNRIHLLGAENKAEILQ